MDDLCEYVINCKSGEACDINNGGLDDQIAYLTDALGEDAVKDILKDLADAYTEED